MESLIVKYWKDGRYAIFDKDTEKIIDDAQGYGYKDKQKAAKAMWWKFKGGKEKRDEEKKLFNIWLKIETNKKIYHEINKAIENNVKEIMLNEITIGEIIQEIENQERIKIPKFVINNLF